MDGLSRFALALNQWVLQHRAAALGLIAVLFLGAAFSTAQTPIQTSIVRGLLPDEDGYREYQRLATMFGPSADDVIIVAVDEGRSVFEPATLNGARAACEQIQAMPEVSEATSLVNMPALSPPWKYSLAEIAGRAAIRAAIERGQAPEFELAAPTSYWPTSLPEQQRVEMTALAESVAKDPLASNLLAKNHEAQLIIVRLSEDAPRNGGRPAELTDRIELVVRQTGLGKAGVVSAGVLVTESAMFREVEHNLGFLLPIGAVIICLIVFAVFHRVSLVALTLGIALIAIVWSLGATSLLFGRISLLVGGAPLLVLVISTSDVIHIASAHRTERELGNSAGDAMRNAIGSVGGACVLTSVTTFVGFLSLAFTPSASVQHVAVALSIGVASALLLALIISPLVLLRLKGNVEQRPWLDQVCNTPIVWLVEVCKRVSLSNPRTVLALTALLAIACVAGISRIRLDVDFPARFPNDHRVGRGVRMLNERFYGANTLDLIVEYPDSKLTPQRVAQLGRLESVLSADPRVEQCVSLSKMLQAIDVALGMETPAIRSGPQLHAVMTMLKRGGVLGPIVSHDGRKMRLSMRINATSIFEISDLAARLESLSQQELGPDAKVAAAGGYVVLARACQLILQRQTQGFLVCFATVMAIIAIGLGNIRLAILSLLPNIMPLLLLGGLLGFAYDVVDTDILAVAIVSFGLAVDDTIHFLHRYEHERRATGVDVRAALSRSFDYTGLSIVRTTVILGLGLAPFALSNYLSLWFLGSYLVFVLAAAVFGDLLVLPALLLLFDRDRSSSDPAA